METTLVKKLKSEINVWNFCEKNEHSDEDGGCDQHKKSD